MGRARGRAASGLREPPGAGGPSTEIYITDELLNALYELEQEAATNSAKMGINQALFTIYVDGADYDWNVTQSNTAWLTPLLDKSFTRLGAYINYNSLSPVTDYEIGRASCRERV